MCSKFSSGALAALAALFISRAGAHTWNEQFQVIDNGKYVGDYGYPRGFFDKHGEPNANESQIVYQIPQDPKAYADDTDYACHPFQRTQNQTQNFPRLQVTPGGYVAMKYLENGHVTQPWVNQGKPEKSGTVFVYGTTQPKDDEKLVDVLQWTSDGSGGDKRGTLLTTQNFDDGRCHQVNPNSCIASMRMQADPDNKMEQWCETDLRIPTNYTAGTTLSIYWLWQWSTSPTFENGKDQFYSSCSDFDIVKGPINNSKPVHTIAQQDPQTSPAANWQSRTAAVATPTLLEWNFEKNQKAVATPMVAVKAPVSVIPLQVLEASACSSASQSPAVSASAAGSSAVATSAAATSAAATSTSNTAATATTGVSSVTFTAPSVSGMTASGVTTIIVTGTVTISSSPGASSATSTSTVTETSMVTVTAGSNAKRDALAQSTTTSTTAPRPTQALPTDANKLSYKHAAMHAPGSYGTSLPRKHSRNFVVREARRND
ncbi:MAG: hypothetical protein M1822_006668 [Bathelium mastoideum]|nr:MAG: hypothetical protein M1822_006668 [Bathelium mastoideum]